MRSAITPATNHCSAGLRIIDDDPKIQKELDIALAHHADEGNEKGVLLCLWAGGNPHAPVPNLRYPQLVDDDENAVEVEEPFLSWSAVYEACSNGHADILRRLGPDPELDDFDDLYRSAGSPAVVELLLSRMLPRNTGEVLQRQLWRLRWGSDRWSAFETIRTLFQTGMRWQQADPKEIADLRRILLKLSESSFVDIMKLLASREYCSASILEELGRTPSMRERIKKVGFFPPAKGEPYDPYRFRPTRSKEVLAKFGVQIPKPVRPLPRRVTIGTSSFHVRETEFDRQALFDRVWSKPLENLAKEWGLSGRGLAKACQRIRISVPARGFWAKIQHGKKIRRPRLPELKPGEAEKIVIRVPKSESTESEPL